MLLLADNEGHKISLENINLENLLKFLFHKRYQSTWCFFWNLHYDARIILRMILPLLSKKDLNRFYSTGRCRVLGYSIHYIEKKKLGIRKEHHSVNFFDIQQFYFEKGLTEAYQKNIGLLDKEYLNMKQKRKSFTKSYYQRNKKKIQDYCIKDCILTKELSGGFHQDTWQKRF
jgi:hypothetical protein